MGNKKGQTAMEYLMTYGWAIIIVVIVGVALWRLGVFTPSAGTVASGFEEFQVTDYTITAAGAVTVNFENADKQSRTVTISSITVDDNACNGATGAAIVGASKTCTGTATAGTAGNPYTGIEVSIAYTIAGSSINHTETGLLSGEYE
ncbi:MAG: hypothetical protein ABIG20_03305 [archaeon]